MSSNELLNNFIYTIYMFKWKMLKNAYKILWIVGQGEDTGEE